MDAETNLVPSWLVGGRDAGYATEFLQDLAGRLASHVQLTSDGHKVYLRAVEDAFGADIDYAMLVKHYGSAPEGEKRQSPAVCIGTSQTTIAGNPDEKHIPRATASGRISRCGWGFAVSRALQMPFQRRLTTTATRWRCIPCTNNFVRIHSSLRTTPAMAAGVTEKLWDIGDMVALLD